MKKFTTLKMTELTGLSRQTLSNKRNGYKDGKGYDYPPELVENEDWTWEKGKVVFIETETVKKLINGE